MAWAKTSFRASVNPDEYYVFKPTLKHGFRPIFRRWLGTKEFKLIYDIGGGKMVKNMPVPPEDREPLRHRRRRDSRAGPLGLPDRRPLHRQARSAHADGHGMGQGRTHRRALHRPGPSGNGPVAKARRGHDRDLQLEAQGRCS